MKARQQSSTSYPILIYMIDTADHASGKTGLTLSVTLSKNGAAFGAASGAVTELANGWYSFAGNATDRNTLGSLAIKATAAGADAFHEVYDIYPYDPFARIDANLVYINGSAASTTSNVTADVTKWNGTSVPSPDTAGYPKVTVKSGTGTGEVSLTSGVVQTNTASIDVAVLTSIADAILKRDFSSVTGEAQRSMLNALRKLINKVQISGSDLNVYKENDSTLAFSQAITTDSNAVPITAVDTN